MRKLSCLFIVAALLMGVAHAEIKIGVIIPLSGSLATYGKDTLDGIKLAVRHTNNKGGINGSRIKLYIEDNRGDKTESKNAYKKLVGTDKVSVIIGPITSTNTLALKRDVKKMKVPIISPTATNDKVTKRNNYVFRSCFKDSFQGEVVANYTFNTLGLTKAACLVDMNSDYSKGLVKSFITAFKKAGGTVVTKEGYRQKDTDFAVQIKKVIDAGAQILFVPGYPPEVPLIIKDAGSVGFKGLLCGADGWDKPVVFAESGDKVEGCFFTSSFSVEDTRAEVVAFTKDFHKAYNRAPGNFEAQGYDTVQLLEQALQKGTRPEDVKKGLFAIKNFKAVTGNISITKEGDAKKGAVILTIYKDKNGVFSTRYTKTVNP